VVTIDPRAPGRVFFAVYSHGNHPPDTVLDAQVKDRLEPAVVIPKNELWYCHFPYASNAQDRKALQIASQALWQGEAKSAQHNASSAPSAAETSAKSPADSKVAVAAPAAGGSSGKQAVAPHLIWRLDGASAHTIEEHTTFPVGAGYEEVPVPGTMYTHYLLHWQALFDAYRSLIARGVTGLVTLHQHCKSGGMLKFMSAPAHIKHHQVKMLPCHIDCFVPSSLPRTAFT
jgi:hypothetical protein